MMQSPGPHLRPVLSESAVYTSVFTVALYNIQDMEANEKSINRGKDKEVVIHTHTHTHAYIKCIMLPLHYAI